MNVDANTLHPQAKEDFIHTVFYGRLEYILECTILPNPYLKNIEPKILLLTIVTTCDTQGCDATLEPTYFKALASYVEVGDLAAICTVVGRIQIGTAHTRWVIIDRSGKWACTVFTDDSLGE